MAENKKGILVYADWIDQFESLTDEEAGMLIKHFFRYVNDQNPVIPNRIIEIAFNPIKNSLKRDLEKWETKKHERSYSGRLGNLKKYNEDLFLQVSNNEISIEKAEEIAQLRKVSHSDDIGRTASQSVANIAVNVNDNVNVINNNIASQEVIDFKKLLEYFNSVTNKKFKTIPDKAKKAFNARIKEGYTKSDIMKSILNCSKDEFHIENPKYLTPEFISRPDKFVKYLNYIPKKETPVDPRNPKNLPVIY